MAETSFDPIAIIGGGFSGSAVALQLGRVAPQRRVLLFERSGNFGAGLAYATQNPEHLLNVPARNMSIFPGEMDHFSTWLAARPAGLPDPAPTDAGLFVPRGLFGDYVASELKAAANNPSLALVPGDVVDIAPLGGGFEIATAGGARYAASDVILALGHVRPAANESDVYYPDPWAADALAAIDRGRSVLVVGTGLTMVDIAIALNRQGMRAPILAVSRHGTLPHPHRAHAAWPAPSFSHAQASATRSLLRRIRSEVASAADRGVDWRSVVDSLRPATQQLWCGLPDAEKARFLRHVRSLWDVHRHRMAPRAAGIIDDMRARGLLEVMRGRLAAIKAQADGAEVTIRLPGGGQRSLSVQRVVDATGPDRQAPEDRLLTRLRERGLARRGPLGIGIDVGRDLRVVGRNGQADPHLWALGPIVRGVFWECTAVPDIRVQAQRMVEALISAARELAAVRS